MLEKLLAGAGIMKTKSGFSGILVALVTILQLYLAMAGTQTTGVPAVVPTTSAPAALPAIPVSPDVGIPLEPLVKTFGWQFAGLAVVLVFLRMTLSKMQEQLTEIQEKLSSKKKKHKP